MQMLAIDLAKQSFHVHGVNSDGEVISRHIGRQDCRRWWRSSIQKSSQWKHARQSALVPIRARDGGLDRPGSAAVFNRRQVPPWRCRAACEPLYAPPVGA